MELILIVWFVGACLLAGVSLITMDIDPGEAALDAVLWPISFTAIVIMTAWLSPGWLIRKFYRQ